MRERKVCGEPIRSHKILQENKRKYRGLTGSGRLMLLFDVKAGYGHFKLHRDILK